MSKKTPEKTVNEAENAPKQATREQVMWLVKGMADTTWRMFVPPALFVGVGIWADLKFGTLPWLAITGAVLGLGASVLLVKRLLAEGATK